MDVILILSRDAYYVARYDDDVDKVTQYQRVALADIEKIEFGVLDQPTFQVTPYDSRKL
jgi:phosphatidylinositol 4-phosphatase